MPHKSKWAFKPLHISIPDFIFKDSSFDANDTIFVDAENPEKHFWTLSSFQQWSKRFALGLQKQGVQPGDRIALFAGNSMFTPVIAMGAIMAGAIYSSINPGFTVREVIHQLRDSEPRLILATPGCMQRAFTASEAVGIDRDRIFVFHNVKIQSNELERGKADRSDWTRLLASAKASDDFMPEALDTFHKSSRTAVLTYSSGTTGLPKGVQISHYQIVNNARQIKQVVYADKTIKERRALCALPFYHGLGLIYYGLAAPSLGLVVYVMERYSPEGVMKNIARHGITEMFMVPPMVLAVAKSPDARSGVYDLRTLTRILCGAAPLGREITQQFEDLWHGKLKVQQAWGMSESPALTTAWDERERVSEVSVSVGELLPGIEAQLVDDEENEVVDVNTPGELWVRGPNTLQSYWRNRLATAATLTSDGWLKTGDVAQVSQDGKWYIVDRKKELIKVRGVQVAPAELEALLLEHEHIVDAAVVGVRTAEGDESPRAYIVARNKDQISPDEVQRFVEKNAAKQKQLTAGVVFVDSIPRTAAGKILRRVLRDGVNEEMTKKSLTSSKL